MELSAGRTYWLKQAGALTTTYQGTLHTSGVKNTTRGRNAIDADGGCWAGIGAATEWIKRR